MIQLLYYNHNDQYLYEKKTLLSSLNKKKLDKILFVPFRWFKMINCPLKEWFLKSAFFKKDFYWLKTKEEWNVRILKTYCANIIF